MREPWTCLALVHAERFEPRVHIGRKRGRTSVLVGEDEHSDAARLAVAPEGKGRNSRGSCCIAQAPSDPVQLSCGARAQERERDVDALARDDTDVSDAGEDLALPLLNARDRLVGEA